MMFPQKEFMPRQIARLSPVQILDGATFAAGMASDCRRSNQARIGKPLAYGLLEQPPNPQFSIQLPGVLAMLIFGHRAEAMTLAPPVMGTNPSPLQ